MASLNSNRLNCTALISLALAVLLASCSSGEKSNSPETASKSQVTDTIHVGLAVHLGDITLRAPRGWLEADSATLATVKEFAGKDTTTSALAPKYVFMREGGGPVLIVSGFPHAVQLGNNFVPWAGEVARVYRTQRPSLKIEEQWLSYGGIEALLLRSKSEKLIHYKVILRGSSPVSLDYTVPAQDWTNEAASVEASLTSIQRTSSK